VIPRATLTTERLVLRPFQDSDVEDALAYRDDREFARFLARHALPYTLQDARDFVALNIREPWERSPVFAVVFQGRLIGTVNLEYHAASRSAMLGYAIGSAWWGRGLGTEAARAVMDWGIRTFALQRIWASTDSRNVRSQRVMEKLGMRREAIRHGDHAGRDGELVDEVVYGLDPASLERDGR
jgi:ribosomal-protein-alanine N-acetyltransferase